MHGNGWQGVHACLLSIVCMSRVCRQTISLHPYNQPEEGMLGTTGEEGQRLTLTSKHSCSTATLTSAVLSLSRRENVIIPNTLAHFYLSWPIQPPPPLPKSQTSSSAANLPAFPLPPLPCRLVLEGDRICRLKCQGHSFLFPHKLVYFCYHAVTSE